jgi:hypothetical protein
VAHPQSEGKGPKCSFKVQVTGRTAGTSVHPLPATEALKLAMLAAVRDELARLLAAGKSPAEDHPVTVSERHLQEGERMASAPSAS